MLREFLRYIRWNILISSQTIKPCVIQWPCMISVIGHVRTLYVWWSSSHQYPIQVERGEFIDVTVGRESDRAAFSTIYWLAVTIVLTATNNLDEISTINRLFLYLVFVPWRFSAKHVANLSKTIYSTCTSLILFVFKQAGKSWKTCKRSENKTQKFQNSDAKIARRFATSLRMSAINLHLKCIRENKDN